MNYQTFQPKSDLASIIKYYWTLQVPAQKKTERQLILPDGCVDICFTLGADIKRYTSETDFLIQPRQMLLGQITEQFYIEPTGFVDTFAIRFYPYGLTNLTDIPLAELCNKETPLSKLFGDNVAEKLGQKIIQSRTTEERIELIETFLFERLNERSTIDILVKSTIDLILLSNGNKNLNFILKHVKSKRRQLERNFKKQIGLSPKQLSKVIRLQATLKMLLDPQNITLTNIAYENEYYDQAHFIRDFKEFTGLTPKEFLTDEKMALSSLLYR